MRRKIAAMSRSARVWAFAACFAAFALMAFPQPAQADGACGCNACMGPAGCISLGTSICYYGTIYTCGFNTQNCASCACISYSGQCQP